MISISQSFLAPFRRQSGKLGLISVCLGAGPQAEGWLLAAGPLQTGAELEGWRPPLSVFLPFGHKMTTPPFKQNQSHLIRDTKLLLTLRTSSCPEEFGEALGHSDYHRVVCPTTFTEDLLCVQPWAVCWGGGKVGYRSEEPMRLPLLRLSEPSKGEQDLSK